ncbi:MAG: hypothetical protein KME64_30105 [Scytonematopsis contorta HA4267-MV1]|jgi:hypothetical protein|nr:hypothetical protein [Scytonematopsis contorta HA4267-MV1]
MSKREYWDLVTLDNAGKRQVRTISMAKTFFAENFTNSENLNEVSDTLIQKRLLLLFQNTSGQDALLAKRCLLCFISWQIEKVCLQLVQDFGHFHGFTCGDLLPYVLDDDGNLKPSTNYQCLAMEILETFDSQKSSLATWANLKVKRHSGLNQRLLEFGLYILSDWAILNDTKINQLKNILGNFYSFAQMEIEQSQILLEAYHNIYRAQRLRERGNNKSKKCNPPTKEQLQEITEVLKSKGIYNLSTQTVMEKLQSLATNLRQYRIHARGGIYPTGSLDGNLYENATLREGIPSPDSNNLMKDVDETEDFLKSYRSQLLICLDEALKTVIESRFQYLQSKKPDKSNDFLTALQLFHCQKLSMSEIAIRLDLKGQYVVTRLLKLKDFRADVRREILVKLKNHVLELAKLYSNQNNLANLETKINDLLDEQIANLISQAETEAVRMQTHVTSSTFYRILCQQLDEKITSCKSFNSGVEPLK